MLNALTSNWYIFFPLAVSLFVALRLAEGSADLGGRSFGISFLRLIIATLLTFSLLAVGLRSNPLGMLWLLLFGFFGFILFLKQRRLERSALLLTALQADNEQKQFTVCESFWYENRGWTRRVSAALRVDLFQGKSWWNALQNRRIARGVYERMAVRLLAKYGPSTKTSAGTTTRLVEGELLKPLQIESEAERLLGRLLLFSWIFLAFSLISMLMMFVVPPFQLLLAEFGRPLPSVMSTIVTITDSAAVWGWGAAFYLLPLGLAVLMFIAVAVWFFPQLLQRLPLRWLCHDYYRTAGFAALAHTLDHEQDLVTACRTTSRLIDLEAVARPYEYAAHLLESGHLPRDAFYQSGLLSRREFQAFQLGFDQRNPTWCLQQLASWKMGRMLRRYLILVQCGVVLITLATAAIVGSLAIGMFQMLSELMSMV